MERREFIGKSGCGMLGLFAGSAAFGAEQAANVAPAQTSPAPWSKPYRIDLEIFEARTDSFCHQKGDKFAYPQDFSKICPWLRTCLHDVVLLLENGVTLNWKYAGTPYEKVIDPNGVTTEYIRCPDPTANLVVKITRTKI